MAENDKRSSEQASALKRSSYLLSIIFFFIIPTAVFVKSLWKNLPKKPFFLTFFTIGVLGWGWSWVVSSNVWWEFGANFLLGFNVIPHLPIEEVLFYPFGGALCVLLYVWVSRKKRYTNVPLYWGFMIVGSAIFAALTWFTRENKPYYLYSQFILYNGLCSFLLAPFVAKRMNLLGLAAPIALLSIVGFIWDYIGFKYGWWVYHAITQIYVSVVPIDDFNFFLFAPTAGVSVYLMWCRLLKSPDVLT
jgi:hypothetical protein